MNNKNDILKKNIPCHAKPTLTTEENNVLMTTALPRLKSIESKKKKTSSLYRPILPHTIIRVPVSSRAPQHQSQKLPSSKDPLTPKANMSYPTTHLSTFSLVLVASSGPSCRTPASPHLPMILQRKCRKDR